jgi:diacylglycerol kinase family enzyme
VVSAARSRASGPGVPRLPEVHKVAVVYNARSGALMSAAADTADDGAADGKTPDDKTPDDKTPDGGSPGEQVPDMPAPDQPAPDQQAPDDKTPDAETLKSVEDRLGELCRRRGLEPVLCAFDPSALAKDVQTLLGTGPDAVIVAGGDGTVRSVAEHLVGGDVPLGVLPVGTMNVLAGDLGIPDELEPALDALVAAPVTTIDVARVNGELFLCSSALAMIPHLGRIREHARGAIGWPLVRWLARGVQIWRRYPRMRLRIVLDGRGYDVSTRAMVVSNNPLSTRPAPIPGRDGLDTGRLAAYVTRDRTSWDLVAIAAKLRDGTWQDDPRMRTYEGRTVEVSGAPLDMMTVMNDGEVTQMAMPLRYEIEPRALAVLAPGRTT